MQLESLESSFELVTPYDLMSTVELRHEVLRWARTSGAPRVGKEVFEPYLHSITPRSSFFKMLSPGVRVLDLGAGDGTMSVFRRWPAIERLDLEMYAVSLEKGSHFDAYDGYELGNFENDVPKFSNLTFGAILCAHFIEHLRDPERCMEWMASRLASGGRLYLEWPHIISTRMPTRFEIIDEGLNVMTINFFDDPTHVEAWPMSRLTRAAQKAGLAIESAGRIRFPWAGDELKHHGRMDNDVVATTMGLWFYFGWAQFLTAFRP
jgi:SAM-dependent methyltransferase